MVQDQIDPRSRRERGEPFQQFDRLEQQMRGPVRPRAPQLEPDLAGIGPLETFLHHRGPQGVAGDALQTVPLLGGHADSGVQIESVVTRLARPELLRFGDGCQRLPSAADSGAGPRTERDPALHRGGREPGQYGCFVCPLV